VNLGVDFVKDYSYSVFVMSDKESREQTKRVLAWAALIQKLNLKKGGK